MAFTPITTTEIATGKPLTNDTLTKVKNNLDDLDARVTALDLTVAQPPIIFGVYGNPAFLTIPYTGFEKTTLNFNLTVTGVFILIDTAGSAGTTEIDLKYSRSGGAYTSILTTKPSVSYTAGNDAISSNAVLNPSYVNLLAGDILRLDITSAQTASRNFLVRIDYLKTT